MNPTSVLFFSPEPARRLAAELADLGSAAAVVPPATVIAPPDVRAWIRAVSELALFNWLVLPTPAAAEAVVEAIGAPPGPIVRVAAVGAAGDVLSAEGRVPEVEAAGLRELLELLSGRLGRRQRALVPHAAVAGRRIGGWLQELGAEAVCRAAYDFELAQPEFAGPPAAAVLADTTDAEVYAGYLRGGQIPEGLPVAALDQGVADAAKDCALSVTVVPQLLAGGRLGPFLGETLS